MGHILAEQVGQGQKSHLKTPRGCPRDAIHVLKERSQPPTSFPPLSLHLSLFRPIRKVEKRKKENSLYAASLALEHASKALGASSYTPRNPSHILATSPQPLSI